MQKTAVKSTLLALTLLGMAWMPLAQAEERSFENTLQTQGVGQVTTKPDSLQVQIGVETDAKTIEGARAENARKMTLITQRLKGLGIPNLVLQTTSFTVYPVRKNDRTQPIIGYHAQNQLSAKVENVTDADKLSNDATQLMDTALQAGATNVYGVNFYLSQNSPAQQDALKLAVKQARQTADAIAEAAGIRITGVYNVESYSQGPAMKASPMSARGMEAMSDAAPSTPVEVGEFDITANVTVRFDFVD